jgi:hypothetical protein
MPELVELAIEDRDASLEGTVRGRGLVVFRVIEAHITPSIGRVPRSKSRFKIVISQEDMLDLGL